MSADLRAIFRDELEDLVGALERASARLDAGDPGAALEIRRAFHTLKGAAQAVGDDAVERACHAAEVEIAGKTGEPGAVAAIARGALPGLRARLAALSRELAPAARPPSVPPGEPGAGAGAASEAADTLRIASERLDAVLAAADDLGAALLEAGSTDPIEQLRSVLAGLRAVLEPLSWSGSERDPEVLRRQARAASAGAREALALADQALRAARATRTSLERGYGALAGELRTLRLAPLSALGPGLERALAEAAATLGREVVLELRGGDVQLDRRTRDELREPLLHLVRNAVDHGIEPPAERARAGKPRAGRVEIRAAIAGGEIELEIADDGRGIDLAAVSARAAAMGLGADFDPLGLVFEPGLSTRAEVGPISGRGLGLDVVRDRVARLHGRVELRSTPGAGTSVSLRLPLASGALRALRARCRGVHLLFPSAVVERVLRARPEELVTIEGRLHLRDPAGPIPMARVDQALGLEGGPRSPESELAWVLASSGERRVALGVDALAAELEVVARALGGRVQRVAGVSGTAVLPEGDVALLLDVGALLRLAVPALASPPGAQAPPRRVLVVDDSITTRSLQRALLESAGYEVSVAPDGREALELFVTSRFDAVVTDLEMPVVDGLDLLERIRALPHGRAVPVVIVTALDRRTDRRRALELGASAYVLKKDFDRERLLATLEDLL